MSENFLHEDTIMATRNDAAGKGKGHAKEKQGMSGEPLKKGQSAAGAESGRAGGKEKKQYGSTGSKSSGGTGSSQGSGGGSGGTHG